MGQLNEKAIEEVAKLPKILADIEAKMPSALKSVLDESQLIVKKFITELSGKAPTEEDFKQLMDKLPIDKIEKALEEAKNAEETPDQKQKMLTYQEAAKELANVKTQEEFWPALAAAAGKLGPDDVEDLTSKVVTATEWVKPIANAVVCMKADLEEAAKEAKDQRRKN